MHVRREVVEAQDRRLQASSLSFIYRVCVVRYEEQSKEWLARAADIDVIIIT